MDFNNLKQELIFIPLGGTNEIGMNMNLYQFQGKWIIVDCGSKFGNDNYPGIDLIIPDISFIKKHKKDILGMILTHAHEDHIGAVPFVIDELECPIYATNFTIDIVKSKLLDYDLINEPIINKINLDSQIKLGPFDIQFVSLPHSAPEMQALYIKTEKGNIFHTGDWKFDHDPIIGKDVNEEQLKNIGKEGVLALVADSTNVFTENNSGSEGDLKKSLYDIIDKCSQMVVVTTFASNVARLASIIDIAKQLNRKIVLSGKSMHRIVNAAKNNGYLDDIESFVDEKNIKNYKKKELLVLATGCQGESRAAINKIATSSHPSIKLAENDTIIFSSKIIPGNEKNIFSLYNKFIKRKINVITERDHFVHVSGHPGIADIQKMISHLDPKLAIPVHGEPIHIHEHTKIAKKFNVPHTIEVANGSVVQINEIDSNIIGNVVSGYLALDGSSIVSDDCKIFNLRKKMKDSGVVAVSIAISQSNSFSPKFNMDAPGVTENIEEIKDIVYSKIKNIILKFTKQLPLDIHALSSNVKKMIEKEIKNSLKKYPLITVNIILI